jgi:hypothetical protein
MPTSRTPLDHPFASNSSLTFSSRPPRAMHLNVQESQTNQKRKLPSVRHKLGQAKPREEKTRADYIHSRTMCHATTCRSCGLTTYAGCGRHIDSALHGVPEEKRCLGWASAGPRCPGPRTQPTNDTKAAHTPAGAAATTVTPGQSAHPAAGQRSAW